MAHILLVDDDQDLRQTIAMVLERDGHDVRQAANGAQALREVQEHLPDAVLVDAQMPVLDGRGFLEARRDQPVLSAVPVVLMSGLLTEGEALSREFPGVCYLAKPFKAAQLRAVVAQAVSASADGPRPPLAG